MDCHDIYRSFRFYDMDNSWKASCRKKGRRQIVKGKFDCASMEIFHHSYVVFHLLLSSHVVTISNAFSVYGKLIISVQYFFYSSWFDINTHFHSPGNQKCSSRSTISIDLIDPFLTQFVQPNEAHPNGLNHASKSVTFWQTLFTNLLFYELSFFYYILTINDR